MAHEGVSEGAAQQDARPDPGCRADQADDGGLPGDHATNLAGGGGHGAQQGDLAFALLDRQTHGAGHHEYGHEHGQPAECGGDRNQRGAHLLEVRILGLPAGRAGEHRRPGCRAAQTGDVEAGPGQHADGVDPSGVAGQAGCLGVGQEDGGLL